MTVLRSALAWGMPHHSKLLLLLKPPARLPQVALKDKWRNLQRSAELGFPRENPPLPSDLKLRICRLLGLRGAAVAQEPDHGQGQELGQDQLLPDEDLQMPDAEPDDPFVLRSLR